MSTRNRASILRFARTSGCSTCSSRRNRRSTPWASWTWPRVSTWKSNSSSAVLTGMIGKKLGMTQVGNATGQVSAVTVIQLGPCAVTQIKIAPTDGYEAVQVTFGKRKLSRTTGALRGHFQKAEVAAGVATREFQRRGEGELKLGQLLSAGDVFKLGDAVDVSAVSKGRGY